MKWLGESIITSPPQDGMLVHHRVPSMKRLWALLSPPPGWDASPSQDAQHEATESITAPPGWDTSPSQDAQLEETRSITTPPGWDASLSQGTQYEVTRSVTTPPGWDASPSQGTQHKETRSNYYFPWMGCNSITVYPV